MHLEVRNLTRIFGSGDLLVQAVRDVTFRAASGEFLAIVGPSGSGKTTLLAMLGGLLTPTSGEITLDGKDITAFSASERAAYRRQQVGYVFQANNLIGFLTARENLLVIQAIGGGGRDAPSRADRLLQELDLRDRANALATNLSGGERQRVAIARALMNNPAMILVDEPTASLDRGRGRQVVRSLLDEVRGRGKLGIMVTHDHEMAAMADRVLTMEDGLVVEDSSIRAPSASP